MADNDKSKDEASKTKGKGEDVVVVEIVHGTYNDGTKVTKTGEQIAVPAAEAKRLKDQGVGKIVG